MENENTTQESPYAFLSNPTVQKYFADMDLDLRQGKHIMEDDYYSYQLLREYYNPELKRYYQELYERDLKTATVDNATYFYLDFPADGKGKLNNPHRYRELTQQQVIIGIVLLKMYYDMYFKLPKELFWENIKEEIDQSEFKELYKKLFFCEIRDFYTDKEWERVEELFRKTINSFAQLGWLKKLSKGKEDIHFRLKESIHRFAELYKYEIEEFPQFVEKIKL